MLSHMTWLPRKDSRLDALAARAHVDYAGFAASLGLQAITVEKPEAHRPGCPDRPEGAPDPGARNLRAG